jgi:hypothetical protein
VRLEHLGGQLTVGNAAELRAALSLRCEGTNEFTLAHREDYPYLAILVKGDLACVHYFPAESEPGSVVVGAVEGLPLEGQTDLGGGPRSSDRWFIGNHLLVRMETAAAVAEEFRLSASRPSCVTWVDL